MEKRSTSFFTWEKVKNSLKNRNRTDYIIVILIGALILIAAVPDGRTSSAVAKKKKESEQSAAAEQTSYEDYISNLEHRLEKLLSKMDGVGSVMVMITLEDQGRALLDKDISKNSEKYEEKTVIFDTGNGKAPYVTQEMTPEIAGVLVVAEGGGNAKTAMDISEAVMALFGLELHKIKIVEMAD